MAVCHNTVRHFCHSYAKGKAFLLSLVPRVLSLPPSKDEERFVFLVPFYPVMAFYHVVVLISSCILKLDYENLH